MCSTWATVIWGIVVSSVIVSTAVWSSDDLGVRRATCGHAGDMDPTAELVRSAVTATVSTDGCDPATLWRLLAQPRWWSHWTPHIRRSLPVAGAGDTMVAVRVRVRMDLRGPLPRPAGAALLAAYRPVALPALHRLVALARDRA